MAIGAKGRRAAAVPPSVIWVTRARPGAEATAGRLRQLKLEAVVEPLLEVRPHPRCRHRPDRRLRHRLHQRQRRGRLRRALAGAGDPGVRGRDATATAARAQRFGNVLSARGDVAALASALATRRRELPGVVLYPAAADPAQDLAGALEAVGLKVRQVTLYETVVLAPSEALVERLPRIDGVLVHSAKAAKALAAFLKTHPAPVLTAFCLSRQIGRSLARSGLARVISAESPNEAALLALLAPAG